MKTVFQIPRSSMPSEYGGGGIHIFSQNLLAISPPFNFIVTLKLFSLVALITNSAVVFDSVRGELLLGGTLMDVRHEALIFSFRRRLITSI